VKYNSDNYTGFVVKFLTPIETKATKETTAAIFDSNKINLYGSNCKEEAGIIKNILKLLIASHDNCTYMKD
jgi:TATA-box binding protein (TBP) (component of TFIID and TFIIIB)